MSKIPLYEFKQSEPGKFAVLTLYDKHGWGQVVGPRAWARRAVEQLKVLASTKGYDMPGKLDTKGKSGRLIDLHFKRRARR